jgi:Acyltransferase family
VKIHGLLESYVRAGKCSSPTRKTVRKLVCPIFCYEANQISKHTLTSPTTPHQRYLLTKYFPSLDGLRAISILAMVWYHAPELRLVWRTGFLGVHLFSVISGFLITTLLFREKSETGKISLKKFYIRRTLRIFPAYCLTLGLLRMILHE